MATIRPRTIEPSWGSLAALEALKDTDAEIAERHPEDAAIAREHIAHAEREIEATKARIARLAALSESDDA